MFENYLRTAIRNLIRHKIHSAINISGLAIGMSSCILILLYVHFELSYDRHHDQADRIYLVVREVRATGSEAVYQNRTSGPLASALVSEFPEVEQATRVWVQGGYFWIRHDELVFEQNLNVADPSILDIFTFPFIKGDPRTSLASPYTIIITEDMAQLYFPDEEPIGKVLQVTHRYFEGAYKVTGVIQNIPQNATFRFDCLTSTTPPQDLARGQWENWNPDGPWRPIETYLLLKEGVKSASLERKLPDLMEGYMGEEVQAHNTYHLQPLTRIYLYSKQDYGIPWYGDIQLVYILSSIALFILLIACINFVNLTTARSVERAREVGLRKAVGAYRGRLICQFLGESFLLSFLAFLCAIALVESLLPTFNAFVERDLSLRGGATVLAALTLIVVLVGLVSGSYPAFYLSALHSVDALRGTTQQGGRGAWIRKALVIFQFTISIVLIVGTAVVYSQIDFLQNRELGYDEEHIVILPLFGTDRTLTDRYETIKTEFLKHPTVLKASAFHRTMGYIGGVRDRVFPEDREGDEVRMFNLPFDEDFLDLFEIELIAGRNLTKDVSTDGVHGFLLNETAVQQLGWEHPIGKAFGWRGRKGVVIGVVKDFHHRPLHSGIGPMFMYKWQEKFDWLALKIRPDDLPGTLASLETQWGRFIPNHPFSYYFLDDSLNRAYQGEAKVSRIFGVFSVLAITIACLGLLGLAAHTTQQRTKEIGVRKVLGASSGSIVSLLSGEFVKLVVVANILAWPIAYYVMDGWLQDFAYRIDLGVGVFLLGGLLALATALATVSWQAIRAAGTDLVDALHSE